MADIFISYSSKDEQIANEICNSLEREGLSCWIAPRNIEVGKEYGGEIIKGIEECKVFFLCLSKSSNESQHVLREVERAVNRKLPIIVYRYEETTLSKSLEYFLASTQWFIPGSNKDMSELIFAVKALKEKKTVSKKVKTDRESQKKKGKKWLWGFDVVALILLIIGLVFFFNRDEKEVAAGDVFTYGSIDLTGNSTETLNWIVLNVDEENETALCIADNIVAFFPYDGAESGTRGKSGEIYFNEDDLKKYTNEQLEEFWGSSDWESSNIRSWLNSDEAIVTFEGAKPAEDAVSLYENNYESQVGFLYSFTEEEKSQLVSSKVETTQKDGKTIVTEDKVFLLSYEEAEKYLIDQNFAMSAVPCKNAVLLEGTGIYNEYYEQGERSTYWGLRTQGDNACSIICAGTGLGKNENFHSEYACSSLMGVRPVIVLPLDYVETLTVK